MIRQNVRFGSRGIFCHIGVVLRLHLRVYGRVQGVFYRASTRDKANELGLCGWIRNRRDGSVEIEVEGDEDAIRSLEAWCHRGPGSARVESLEVSEIPVTGKENDFDVLPTM